MQHLLSTYRQLSARKPVRICVKRRTVRALCGGRVLCGAVRQKCLRTIWTVSRTRFTCSKPQEGGSRARAWRLLLLALFPLSCRAVVLLGLVRIRPPYYASAEPNPTCEVVATDALRRNNDRLASNLRGLRPHLSVHLWGFADGPLTHVKQANFSVGLSGWRL
jgi:hypothetical protein